jgi:16S rRNA (guanine966-N2)-methyltransferase
MRIVAGSAKGVRLGPVPRGVRPVSDMAREGVFSSLGPLVEGARVLDLYAGTGAMAIEALSRGAAHAVLVERDRSAARTIRDNLVRARVEASAEVVVARVASFLDGAGASAGPFDLVLVDPPYATPVPELEAVLAALGSGRVSGPDWRVILTRPKEASTLVIPVHWLVARRLSYGDTRALIFQEA